MSLGITPYDQLLAAVAAKDDPNSGARQMPSHWSNPSFNIFSRSSATGTQFLQAVGAAEAGYRYSMIKEIEDRAAHFKNDEVVYVSAGDGTTSEGEFWESLNTASNLKLPVLYLIEDNGYAISVPVEVQTSGGSISRLVSSFPNFYIEECDGTDFLASYETLSRAVEYVRERRGPALVHAHVIRPYSHSQSDDEKLYRPEEERAREAARDPIKRFGDLIIREGVLTEEELQKVKDEVDAEVNEAAERALASPSRRKNRRRSTFIRPTLIRPPRIRHRRPGAFERQEGTMVDLINRCLHEEMERNPRIVVLGEDVADVSRAEYLNRVKGKGGVFKVTANLQRSFGGDRVYNTPLAEANVIGRSHGYGHARTEAHSRNPVLRLHLARVHANARRGSAAAVAFQQRLEMPDGRPRSGGRLSERRRDLSQPIRSLDLHIDSRMARGHALNRARRERVVAHRHPVRRPGALPRTQTPLSPDVQQEPLSRDRIS